MRDGGNRRLRCFGGVLESAQCGTPGIGLGLLCGALVLLTGCYPGPHFRAGIQSPDPNNRILAIRDAADKKDAKAVPLLVDRLEDEDAAVRFFTILALDRITGERFGYEYSESADRRAGAVRKWRAYVRDRRHAPAVDSRKSVPEDGKSESGRDMAGRSSAEPDSAR